MKRYTRRQGSAQAASARLASRVLRRQLVSPINLSWYSLVMARASSRSGWRREDRQPFHAPSPEAGELVCALKIRCVSLEALLKLIHQ